MMTFPGTAAWAPPPPRGWRAAPAAGPRAPSGGGRPPLPIGRLTGVASELRGALKGQRISTCGQLLAAAGEASRRAALARSLGLHPERLLRLVRDADLARVRGLGAVFRAMLGDVGVADVAALAAQDPAGLHARLRAHNREANLARRAPTPGEVEGWVGQARALPPLVGH